MKPRARLLEDPSIAAAVRADLELVLRHPYIPDLQRAAQALSEALAEPAVPEARSSASEKNPADAPNTPSGAALSQLGGLQGVTVLQLVLPVAIAAAVVGVGLWQLWPDAPPPSAPSARHAAARAEPTEVPTSASKSSSKGSWGAAPPTAANEQTGAGVTQSSAQPQAVPDAQAARAPLSIAVEGEPSAASREIAQLRRIQLLLEVDPSAAYRLARASQREFPIGALAEEREGLTVLALFRMGQLERARSLARRFLASHPESPLRARIEELVGSEAAR